MRYRWDVYELDVPARELRAGGEVVHLEPQVFDVLAHLVGNRERVVPKEELLDEVWRSRFVGESALTSRIQAIRRAVADSGRAQHTIRTAHGVGYQFVATLEAIGDPPAEVPVGREAPTRSLPPVEGTFRGRAAELAELEALAGRERLVSVLGPGGTGKTRLAVEWARGTAADRRGAFVDLAAAREPAALGEAVAAALGIQAGQVGDTVEACGEYLRSAPHWLVLDNCEHLPAAAAALAGRLLDLAPSTTIVATSRLPLGDPREVLYRLDPLPVPETGDPAAGDNAAVALFVDRVRRVRHDFELDDSLAGRVVELCRALDGLPLAIELAAGRMEAFGIDDLLARLDRRLDLLGDPRPGRDERHRSLRATLEWSYGLLDDDGRQLLSHLSVFPAGVTLGGAEWLGDRLGIADPWGTLATLVEASLLARVDSSSGSRYVQLETMRTFGVDRLTADAALGGALDLLAEWALALCAELDRTLAGTREAEWDERIRRELPNLRAARHRLLGEQRLGDLVDVSAALLEWGRLRGVSEIWSWSDELLDLLDGMDGGDGCRARAVAAESLWRRGRFDRAAELATEVAGADACDDWSMAHALSSLAVASLFRGDLDRAAELWERRFAIDGHVADGANVVLCHTYAGRFEEARTVAERAHRAAIEMEWPTGIAWAEYLLGELGAAEGAPDHVEWLQAAIDRSEEVGSTFIAGVAGVTLATSVAAAGDVEGAAGRLADLVDHWLRSGSWTQQWTTLRHAAALLEDSDPGLALAVLVAADADPLSSGLDATAAARHEALRGRLVAALGPQGTGAASAPVDRVELAHRTAVALATLADGAR